MRPLRLILLVAIGVYIWTLTTALGLNGGGNKPSDGPYPYSNKVLICHHTGSA